MDLHKAVDTPRIHLEGKTLFYEPEIKISKNISKNVALNAFNEKNLFFGGVNAVSRNNAVGDHRRGGHGITC